MDVGGRGAVTSPVGEIDAMRYCTLVAAVAAALLTTGAAQAQVTVDGNYDAAYGAAKSHVTYQLGAPSNNFSAPTPFSDTRSYDIFLTSDANNVYGFLKANVGIASAFANLYFDINPAAGNGSDIGFEINNGRAFIPGVSGYSAGTAAVPLSGITYTVSSDRSGIEFSIANSLFTSQIAGLTYASQALPVIGDTIRLNLSQSFGYSVAGGLTYGDNRLGLVTLGGANATGAVPEPATWAMMIAGFGMVGGTMRRRARRTVAFA